jgi:hypothetical protein
LRLAPTLKPIFHNSACHTDAESQRLGNFRYQNTFWMWKFTGPSPPVLKNLLLLSPEGGAYMKQGLAELARSRMARAQAETAHLAMAQSEALIARQRELISRLHARGRPTAADERVLAQIETNMRLMDKVQRFIKTGQPRPA